MSSGDVISVEARPYGPTAGEAEEELRARMAWLEDGIVLYREVPIVTAHSIDVMFDELRRITADTKAYSLLLDLTEAHRPSAEIREHLRTRFLEGQDRTTHVAIFTGSFLLTIAATFVFGGLGFRSISTHRTREKALEAIHRVVG